MDALGSISRGMWMDLRAVMGYRKEKREANGTA